MFEILAETNGTEALIKIQMITYLGLPTQQTSLEEHDNTTGEYL